MNHSVLFSNEIISEQVNIHPNELNKDLDKTIIDKLKSRIEGKCTQYGFIQKVLRIKKKELNSKINDNGSGDCNIKVDIEVNRYLPKKEQIIECKITADDEHMGVYISYEEPIFISIINTTSDVLHINDIVLVKIEDFQLKQADSIINIMSSYIQKVQTGQKVQKTEKVEKKKKK